MSRFVRKYMFIGILLLTAYMIGCIILDMEFCHFRSGFAGFTELINRIKESL
jgi:hypothetical protein